MLKIPALILACIATLSIDLRAQTTGTMATFKGDSSAADRTNQKYHRHWRRPKGTIGVLTGGVLLGGSLYYFKQYRPARAEPSTRVASGLGLLGFIILVPSTFVFVNDVIHYHRESRYALISSGNSFGIAYTLR